MLAVCYRCNFCPVGLRILSTSGFRLGKCFRYARLFSFLEFNFCPIHFSVNLIAICVSETRETRCCYVGAMSEISGHVNPSQLHVDKDYTNNLTQLKSRDQESQPASGRPVGSCTSAAEELNRGLPGMIIAGDQRGTSLGNIGFQGRCYNHSVTVCETGV